MPWLSGDKMNAMRSQMRWSSIANLLFMKLLSLLFFCSNLFFMKTSKDFSDGHLWYSVISRPPSSTFTCVQRISCCFSLLLCTMLTSVMFYGIPADPSEQTMDLGTTPFHYSSIYSKRKPQKGQYYLTWGFSVHIQYHLQYLTLLSPFPGHFEFTWQQFMVGVQSSLIMFPVNILIVSIFRNTRPRETSCCKRKSEKLDALKETSIPKTASTNMDASVTLETVIKVCASCCLIFIVLLIWFLPFMSCSVNSIEGFNG